MEFLLEWDEIGEPEMLVPDELGLMGGFFATEIRAKLNVSAWLVETIANVLAGHQSYELVTGESYEVLIHDGMAKISSEFATAQPNPLTIPLQEFLEVAKKWDAFINAPPS